jgi:23S rRNA (cytidine1920-2'-O)/16S rRNA (cytidine1409-2'-O)-methyltransferase
MNAPGVARRADVFLVEQGLAASRAEAQAAIAAGSVTANGRLLTKSSQMLSPGVEITYRKAHPFVSRGALKLTAALDHFRLSPEGRVCLDIGASTGGFTEVLLQRGASKVFAVDVGHGQLHPKLARDPRVISYEGVNARALSPAQITDPPGAIVADVSFIGLKLILPPALALAAGGAFLVVLVKPQFEVGPEHVSRGGLVRDEKAQHAAVEDIQHWLGAQTGWNVLGWIDSPIQGGDGNREFLLAAAKT